MRCLGNELHGGKGMNCGKWTADVDCKERNNTALDLKDGLLGAKSGLIQQMRFKIKEEQSLYLNYGTRNQQGRRCD